VRGRGGQIGQIGCTKSWDVDPLGGGDCWQSIGEEWGKQKIRETHKKAKRKEWRRSMGGTGREKEIRENSYAGCKTENSKKEKRRKAPEKRKKRWSKEAEIQLRGCTGGRSKNRRRSGK